MGELAKQGHYACALDMPDPAEPKVEAWVARIRRVVAANATDEIYLVGHSLGVAAILRFLEQWSGESRLSGAVLVTGPSSPVTNHLTKDFLVPFDYDRIRTKIGLCTVIHGDSDEIVPPEQADVHAQGLGAPLVIVKGAGHFNGSSGCFALPECLEALLNMMEE